METLLQAIKTVQSVPPRIDFDKVKLIRSDYANWVIPGRLMCGPTPGPTTYFPIVDPKDYQININNIVADGIDTFVCLQEELNPVQSYQNLITKPGVRIVHYPFKDDNIPASKTVFCQQVAQLVDMLRQGRNIYVHCAGGHGRTSLYVAAIMACIYKEMRHTESVLYYVQTVHDMRRNQKKQFYGILPCMICCSPLQRDLLRDFIALLSFM